jgi:hypothetical protein
MRNQLALFGVAILVASCASAPAAVDSNPTSTELATATATPSPTPQSTERPIGAGDVVATIVENLRVRTAPGTDERVLGTLDLGEVGFVRGDSVMIDGVPWYPVSGLGLPPGTGCEAPPDPVPFGYCGGWLGWVAGANADGEPWLERTNKPDCPDHDIDGILSVNAIHRLACFGDDELTFTAYWPELPPDAGLGGTCREIEENVDVAWLICRFGPIVNARETDEFFDGLQLSIDPKSDVEMPGRGHWLHVTGHFGDPAAQRCGAVAEGYGEDPLSAVFECRLQFVPMSITRISAP